MMMGSIEGANVVEQDGWIIVRTSAGRTLALARALNAAGIEAWSPADVREWRKPRSNKRVEKEVPILGGFVFARAAHLAELLAARVMTPCPFPAYSLFRWNDGYPLIADRALEHVRRLEASRRTRRALKEKRKKIAVGTVVRTESGGFEGLIGVVSKSDERFATVVFPGSGLEFVFASCLLSADGVTTQAIA